MTSTAAEFQAVRLSAEIPPSTQRSVVWHEQAIVRCLLTPLSDAPLRVDTTVRRVSAPDIASCVCVQRMTFTAGCTSQRTPGLLADSNDDVDLHIHETGGRTLSQLGREAMVGAGGGVLSSTADVSTSSETSGTAMSP